ncbi:MAG: rhodanese-like domain-containing protein [Actinomycetota bacterium]|nr:rhodanese-like domain-containing protein [Actinomycetota bacterium]
MIASLVSAVHEEVSGLDIVTISREELKTKLDRRDDFRLVMTLNEWAFEAQHIPGSLHFNTPADYAAGLGLNEEIVVYCSDPACVASRAVYTALVENGYTNVRRYEGGLSDWVDAGYSLEGTAAE